MTGKSKKIGRFPQAIAKMDMADFHCPQGVPEAQFGSYRKLLLLAGPLILSHMGLMLMQVVDGLFLARYSKNAIAAIGPAGMTFWLLCGLFIGLVGYTNTFVAQYVGAKQNDRVGSAVWQGIYLSLLAAAVLLAASLIAKPLFVLVGHEAGIQADEVVYFRTLCYGGLGFMLSAAISGFFAGRNDNVPLMLAAITGNLVNALGAWILVFGRLGLPEMGMAGAAWAAVAGQSVQMLVLACLLFRPRFVREFGIWRDRHVDLPLMWRMCQYGFPNGVRYVIEILAWTVFLLLLGRVDADGLAASNIVWRINGMAFFPVIGLSIAVSMLVGQAQGAGRPDLSRKVTCRGLILGQIWMACCAVAMVAIPNLLLDVFLDPGAATDHELRGLSVILLRFVAVYCLVDGLNILFMSVLAGAGDTRWMLIVSGGLHAGFVAVLLALSLVHASLYTFWLAATIFIFSAAVAWIIRFRSGRWENKRVIDRPPTDVIEGPAASFEMGSPGVALLSTK